MVDNVIGAGYSRTLQHGVYPPVTVLNGKKCERVHTLQYYILENRAASAHSTLLHPENQT